MARNPKTYRVGIDVGTHSVGLAAIEFDDLGRPKAILSAVSHLHDSGVLEAKTATTRLAAAGVARRTRRLLRRRSKRLVELDRQMAGWGWPEPGESNDPYAAWRSRARLASEIISDENERNAELVRALRHMARHRGWRNPYTSHKSFYKTSEPSEFFVNYRNRVIAGVGVDLDDDLTVAELAVAAIDHNNRRPLRMGKTRKRREDRTAESYLGGKLMQADNANEIHDYARVQGLSDEQLHSIIDLVFAAESPRGSWIKRIGKDPLDGRPRAPKATDAFQRFRILTTLANVRVGGGSEQRPLTLDERTRAYEFLVNLKPGEQPTWTEVGRVVELARGALQGTANLDNGEERLPLRPPIMATDAAIRTAGKKLQPLIAWWGSASTDERDSFIGLITDGIRDESTAAGNSAWELLNELDEDALGALETLDLPGGRASYSVSTLRAISEHLLAHEGDLHSARKAIFGVDDDWTPPADPINAPVGNPAVDRVVKIVGRFLAAAESEWGAPRQVTVEHVRQAFVSEATVRERERETHRRMVENERQRLAVKSGPKDGARTTVADVRRYDAITRQNCECAYCGVTVTFQTAEMDHIVPRKGVGSTNTRTNLVAVCGKCNSLKRNTPFASWARSSGRPGVSVEEAVGRTRHWIRDKGLSSRSWQVYLKEVRERLERTEDDPEIDGRSMESVAWMANELRDRIASHYGSETKVRVYQGAVTAGARDAAGITGKIPFVGGGGKTRLDQRHHAVDAAVVTLLDESIAKTLAERNSLRTEARTVGTPLVDWRTHSGHGESAKARFSEWRSAMEQLARLLVKGFGDDDVVVVEDVRLRAGVGPVHEETVRPFTEHITLGGSFTRVEFMRLATPALWKCVEQATTFDGDGNAEQDAERRGRLHGRDVGPTELLPLLPQYSQAPTPLPALAVRGGYAELGSEAIHHVRIYKDVDRRGKPVFRQMRVYVEDLRRHRAEDLFAVELPVQSISRRAADPAFHDRFGEMSYLGWLVRGDEIRLEATSEFRGKIARFLEQVGPVSCWRVTGFGTPTKLTLVPSHLSKEGLEHSDIKSFLGGELDAAEFVLGGRWSVSVNELFTKGRPTILRRDALGRERWASRAHLPTCWKALEG